MSAMACADRLQLLLSRLGAAPRRAFENAAAFDAATPRIAKTISAKSDVSRNGAASDRMPAPARCISRAITRRSVVSRYKRGQPPGCQLACRTSFATLVSQMPRCVGLRCFETGPTVMIRFRPSGSVMGKSRSASAAGISGKAARRSAIGKCQTSQKTARYPNAAPNIIRHVHRKKRRMGGTPVRIGRDVREALGYCTLTLPNSCRSRAKKPKSCNMVYVKSVAQRRISF